MNLLFCIVISFVLVFYGYLLGMEHKTKIKLLTKPTNPGWWYNDEYSAYVWVFKEDGKLKFGVYTFIDGSGDGFYFFDVEESNTWQKVSQME